MTKKGKDRDDDGSRLDGDKKRYQDLIVDQLKYYEKMVSLGDLYKTSDPKDLGMALAREAPGLVSDLVRSSIEMQSSMLERSTEHFQKITESLFSGKTRAASGSTIRLSLEAAPGTTHRAAFKLKNPDAEEMVVSFTIPVLRRDKEVTLGSDIRFLRKATNAGDDKDGAGKAPGDLKTSDRDLRIDGKASAEFEVEVAVPMDAKGGCYEGTAHVVAGSNVLGHVEVVLNVQHGKRHALHLVNERVAVSEKDWKVKNPSASAQPLFVPMLLKMNGESSFPAFFRVVSAEDLDKPVFEIEERKTEKCRFLVSRADDAPLPAGRYHAVVPVAVGSEVVAQYSVELTVEPPRPEAPAEPAKAAPEPAKAAIEIDPEDEENDG